MSFDPSGLRTGGGLTMSNLLPIWWMACRRATGRVHGTVPCRHVIPQGLRCELREEFLRIWTCALPVGCSILAGHPRLCR